MGESFAFPYFISFELNATYLVIWIVVSPDTNILHVLYLFEQDFIDKSNYLIRERLEVNAF